VEPTDAAESIGLIAAGSAAGTAESITAAIEGLVARGAFAPGFRLPTVRQLARRLEVSPTTIAAAWQKLSEGGVIETRGRAGSFVVESATPRRRAWLSGQPGRYRLDLSTGTPDPTLLPDLATVIARMGAGSPEARSYLGPVVLPELEETIRADLGFQPEALTIVDGAIDALDRVMAQVVRRGSSVIVEDPCFPPIAELVEEHGGRLVPVSLDGDGMSPAGLDAVGNTHPAVLVFQPRANNPAGVSVSPARLERLSEFVARHPNLFVIEDDSAGDIACAPELTLSTAHPTRVAHIRSYSKSHGPDLRMAALVGPSTVIDAVVERRRLGPVWTPRVLQRVLHHMLTDADVIEQVRTARAEYSRRRALLIDLLGERGLAVGGGDGINLWIPVADERDALVALASVGIGVAPGSPFQRSPGSPPHIRVTVGVKVEAWDDVADHIAAAATGSFTTARSLV
jgi:DNA-binding transcriptional MocR family regulator